MYYHIASCATHDVQDTMHNTQEYHDIMGDHDIYSSSRCRTSWPDDNLLAVVPSHNPLSLTIIKDRAHINKNRGEKHIRGTQEAAVIDYLERYRPSAETLRSSCPRLVMGENRGEHSLQKHADPKMIL